MSDRRASDIHPWLWGIGGGALIVSMLVSFGLALLTWITDTIGWWVAMPLLGGLAVFVGTALAAAVLDGVRGARR